MTPVGIILLAIVVGCAIVLIGISRKRKAADREKVCVPSESVVPHLEEKEEPVTPVATSVVPSQNTIYLFRRKTASRLCPFCDGENGERASACSICGHDL